MALGALAKKESLSEKAYGMLREAILDGELKPGDILTEEGVAELLKISRTPVRSALQQLTLEGMLKPDHKTLVVAGVDDAELQEIDQVRAELEPLSAELVSLRGLDPEQAEELHAYCRRQAEAARGGLVKDFFLAGERFHIRLAEFSGNRYLAELIRRASASAVRYLVNQESPEQFLDESGSEHEEILQLILDGDGQTARAKMREHVLQER